MRILLLSATILFAGALPDVAAGQSNRQQLRIYNQQAAPRPPMMPQPLDQWQSFRKYDHDRLEPGQTRYYPDRYSRAGRYYQRQRLDREARIYVGSDERYYCRRSDGTTGLVLTGLRRAGALERLQAGESGSLGTLAQGDARLSRSIDDGKVICR